MSNDRIADENFNMPKERVTSNSEQLEYKIPFYETLREIKNSMFRRNSSNNSSRSIDLSAVLDYSLSAQGMGLV